MALPALQNHSAPDSPEWSTFQFSPILQGRRVRLGDWGGVGVGTFPAGVEISESPLGFPVPIPQDDTLRREWGIALLSQQPPHCPPEHHGCSSISLGPGSLQGLLMRPTPRPAWPDGDPVAYTLLPHPAPHRHAHTYPPDLSASPWERKQERPVASLSRLLPGPQS